MSSASIWKFESQVKSEKDQEFTRGDFEIWIHTRRTIFSISFSLKKKEMLPRPYELFPAKLSPRVVEANATLLFGTPDQDT